ncbi:MAG: ABC transporter permease [Nocardioides sp.]
MTAFTGVRELVRFVLRRDRVYLPVWILAIVGLTYASAAAVRRTYDTPVEIASYAVNLGESPASIAMAGPPVALTEIGGILIYETSMTALLGVALMAVFVVVRHTRAEEDAGRVELLGSTVVSPHAVITAAVLVAGVASVLVGAGVTMSFLAEQQPVRESLLYGGAVAAMGLVFAGVAACAAQVMSHGRSAIGLSLAVLGLAFGLRAIGDVGENAWSWLSPMGWSQQVRVYDDNRWWPLLLSLGLTALLIAATVAFEARRDLGAGIVPARPGPAEGGRQLSGVVGLMWRLQRGTILGWSVGLLTMGLLFGSFSESIENMVEDNPTLAEYFEQTGGASIVDAFFATSLLLMAIGASGFAVSSALRTRSEETTGRLEGVLAAAVSRPRWLFGSLAITLVGTTLVVALGGLGVGVSYAATSGDNGAVWRMTGFALAYLPATLLLAALTVLVVGWRPRASGAGWGVLALCFVIGWLGSLLELPAWVNDLSPFTHVPAVPAEAFSGTPLVVLLLLGTACVAAGATGFRRRDIISS